MSQTNAVAHADSIGRIAELIGGDPTERVDADMKHVLDAMEALGARPLEMMTPGSARRQPGLKDAVRAILLRQGRGISDDGVEAEDVAYPGAEGELSARIYRPVGLLSRLNPMVLYFHGGGFVTGDLDSHDASARTLARRTGAIVISADYRLAPEAKFPAAHDDAIAAWQWLLKAARELHGDPRRIALAGEDAGANLCMHIALVAREAGQGQPVHQLLIHPIAGGDMTRPSYGEMLRGRPVGMPGMHWRMRHALEDREQLKDKRIELVGRDDLAGLPPTTLVLAELDPLRSEGEALAEALEGAGVKSNVLSYDGVTQGFFGLGVIVNKALFAQSDASEILVKAFVPGQRS